MLGGEEFVISLNDMRLSDAGMLAHRIRLATGGINWSMDLRPGTRQFQGG